MMGNFVFRTDPLGATRIRLVAGGGMGGIFRQVFITGSPNDVTRSQTLSAYQGFGGIQINPGEPDLMVDVQFRYLNSLAGTVGSVDVDHGDGDDSLLTQGENDASRHGRQGREGTQGFRN